MALVSLSLVALLGAVDCWLAGRALAIPLHYVPPLLALAWLFGRRPAAYATLLAALVNLAMSQRFGPLPQLGQLLRAATFVGTLVVTRWVDTLRLMLEFYTQGEAWRPALQPRRVGHRIVLLPAQPGRPLPPREPSSSLVQLALSPGLAFGSGSHPTTRMCLTLLEEYLRPGDRVLDFGCGSGILAVASARLGASWVLAVDLDPEAERATSQNIALNDVTGVVEFRRGSLEVVQEVMSRSAGSATSGIGAHAGRSAGGFELVLANILTGTLLQALGSGLGQTLVPAGMLIVSGIRLEQGKRLRSALEAAGLAAVEERQEGDWLAIAAQPRR